MEQPFPMQCPKCGRENRDGATFCDACGGKLEYTCPRCGGEIRPKAKFCGKCGEALESVETSVEMPAEAPVSTPSHSAEMGGAAAPDAASSAPIAAQREADPSAQAPAQPPMPPAFGAGRYQVTGFLGEGGKKRVYRAHDTRLDRDVAISVIKSEGMSEHDLARVRREAQAMAWLGDHPNVVTIHDIGEEGSSIYIVSQYMDGGDVDGLLREAGGPLEIDQALEIASQIAAALEHAHEKGIVHRDIKPGNVWLASDGTAKLGDFGLAMLSNRTRITAVGMMIGTINYMAPEIVMGKSREADSRCDIYSLGAMLFEMLTGRPPFEGNLNEIISAQVNTPPVPPSSLNPAVSPELDSLVLWMLAKSPEDRPKNAQMVIQSIAAIRAGTSQLGPAVASSIVDEIVPTAEAVTPIATPDETEPAAPPAAPSPSAATTVFRLDDIPTAPPDPEAAAPPPEPAPGLEDDAAPPALTDSLIGRESELDDLEWILTESTAGRGRFVLITGEAGVGRSRLAAEVTALAAGKAASISHFTCRELDCSKPYSAFLPLVASLVDEYEVSKLKTDLGIGADQLATLLVDRPDLRRKLEFDGGPRPPDEVEPESGMGDLRPGLMRLIRRKAAAGPLLIVIDDIELADSDSLMLLEELAFGCTIISMLIIATCDPNGPGQAHQVADRMRRVEMAREVPLAPLPLAATTWLAASVFGRMPREPLAEAIFDKSHGLPLLTTEFARALLAEGEVSSPRPDDFWREVVPDTLVDAVARHLTLLSPESATILHAASLVGDRFNLPLLTALTNFEEAELRELLQAPLFQGLIVALPETIEEFEFAHPLIRDAVEQASMGDEDDGESSGPAHSRWRAAVIASTRANLAGEFAEAERLAEEAQVIGREAGIGDVDRIFSAQIFAIRREQGRLAEVEPAISAIAGEMAGSSRWQCALAVLYADTGRDSEARSLVEKLATGGDSSIERDENWLGLVADLALVVAALRDGDRSAALAEELAPMSGRIAVTDAGATCEGAVDRVLGLLADALARDDEAVRYLERAIRTNDALGAIVLGAHVRRELAAVLLHRDRDGDRARAADLLHEAGETYRSLGLSSLAETAERAGSAVAGNAAAVAPPVPQITP